MKIIIKDNYEEMSYAALGLFIESLKGSKVLGFATGNTPKLLYGMISNECIAGNISFKGKYSFNLDEYYPISRTDGASYHHYMDANLFKNIDIDSSRINFPDAMLSPDETVRHYSDAYREFGPVDLQILGIGHNGHIGFNEPGSPRNSRIRVVQLSNDTIMRNNTKVRTALTMGVKEILESRKIIVIASGKEKSEAVKNAVNGKITEKVPASFLQEHKDAVLVLDGGAASML